MFWSVYCFFCDHERDRLFHLGIHVMQIDDNKIMLIPDIATAGRIEHLFNVFALALQLVDRRCDVLVQGRRAASP